MVDNRFRRCLGFILILRFAFKFMHDLLAIGTQRLAEKRKCRAELLSLGFVLKTFDRNHHCGSHQVSVLHIQAQRICGIIHGIVDSIQLRRKLFTLRCGLQLLNLLFNLLRLLHLLHQLGIR